MKRYTRVLLVSSLGVAAVFAAYSIGRARADGIPQSDTVIYRGTLLSNGAPAPDNGDHTIVVELYDSKSAGNLLCSKQWTGTTSQGRFEVSLPTECTEAIRDHPDIWIQLRIDNQALARSRIGAVPYAVEAARATSPGAEITFQARLAAAVGACASRGPATGAQSVLPFRFASDNGTTVCSRDGSSANNKCIGSVSVSLGVDKGGFANSADCTTVYPEWQTLFACCDDP